MKIARFRDARRVAYGVVDGEEIAEVRGSIFARFRITDIRHKLSDVKLLAPTEPVQLWCPGLNFHNHQRTSGDVRGGKGTQTPLSPEPWHKGRNALVGHEDFIIIPKDSGGDVHYEGVAVAVIGKPCRRVSREQAMKYVLGFTCGNDVSERTWQVEDRSFWRSNGSDTFAPVGPWIETDVDPNNLEIVVRVNGENAQNINTRDMIHDFSTLISYISQHATLSPGDLVYSGTTGTTGTMRPDDRVEVEVNGVGALGNIVKAED